MIAHRFPQDIFNCWRKLVGHVYPLSNEVPPSLASRPDDVSIALRRHDKLDPSSIQSAIARCRLRVAPTDHDY